jgi:hypothetical protein
MQRLFLILQIVVIAVFSNLGCKSREKARPVPEFQTSNEMLLPNGEVLYNVPKGWIVERPSGEMRKAQFKWPGSGGNADAELAVFFFHGTGGSVEANIDRWFSQFAQPDGSPSSAKAVTKQIDVNGLSVTIVYVTGTYLKPKAPMMMSGPFDEMMNYALLAAIVETAHGPWFFKATGPEKTIERWRSSFDAFTSSFRIGEQS